MSRAETVTMGAGGAGGAASGGGGGGYSVTAMGGASSKARSIEVTIKIVGDDITITVAKDKK